MNTKIKICGIKTIEIAKYCVANGADMLGLVFAQSKRQIAVAEAVAIRKALPETILVGVFKNQSLEEIALITSLCGLNIVQLHGDESPDFLQEIKMPIWRSVAIDADGAFEFAFDRWRGVEAFLLDTSLADGSSGGAGKPFAWDKIKKETIPDKFVVAGGLNAENVGKAVNVLAPWAVDVSGGVEINGEKSPELIKQFIDNVRKQEKG